jgi:hypothetical protein
MGLFQSSRCFVLEEFEICERTAVTTKKPGNKISACIPTHWVSAHLDVN